MRRREAGRNLGPGNGVVRHTHMIAPPAPLPITPFALGLKRAKEVLLLGEMMDAEVAAQIGLGAGGRRQAWMAAPQATRSLASGRPQAVRASIVCWPAAGAGSESWPGVREKRGAGAGWIMPSPVT